MAMRRLLDVRSGEKAVTFGAFATLLLVTAAHTLLETARDALFLAKLPAERLPWMYIAIAAVGLVVARVGRQASGAIGSSLVVATLVTAAFWSVAEAPSTVALYALFVWTGTLGSWLVLQFWLVLGGAMHVGQAKRLFGFIGAGSVLGATLGAAGARALTSTLEARHLLLGAAVLFAAAALPTRIVQHRARGGAPRQTTRSQPRGPAGSLVADLRQTAGDDYLRRILGVILVATVCFTLVDFVFKAIVAAEVPKEELGRTFASVYTVFNALALVVQLAAIGPTLRTIGVHRALVVLPVLVALGSVGVFAVPVMFAAFALRGADGVLRHSLHRTTVELLYLPLAEDVRARAKPVVDLVAQRGGQALASIGILGVTAAGGGVRILAAVAAILAAAWLGLAAKMGRPYLEVFRAGLRKGRIEVETNLPDLDLGALEALFTALNSPRDGEVLGALDVLAAQKRHRLVPALVLYHPSRAVVLRALEIFVEEGRDDFVPITDRLLEHADPVVRAAALRARAKVTDDGAYLRSKLADPRPEIRATALVALVARGELGHVDGTAQLEVALADESILVKVAVIKAMAEEPSARFAAVLLAHAERETARDVQIEIAIALGAHAELPDLDAPPIARLLARWLPYRRVGSAARQALADLATGRMPMLDALFEQTRAPVSWCMPRVLELCDPRAAAPVLERHLASSEDGIVRFRCLKALRRLRREDPSLTLDGELLTDVGVATEKLAFTLILDHLVLERGQRDVPSRATAAGRLLLALLKDKSSYALGRLFLVLGLLYPEEDFERLHRGITSDNAKTKASCRELCENAVKPPLKAMLLLLIDDLDDDARIERAAPLVELRRLAYDDLVRELAKRHGEVEALARYHAKELGVDLEPAVETVDAGELARGIAEARELPVRQEAHV